MSSLPQGILALTHTSILTRLRHSSTHLHILHTVHNPRPLPNLPESDEIAVRCGVSSPRFRFLKPTVNMSLAVSSDQPASQQRHPKTNNTRFVVVPSSSFAALSSSRCPALPPPPQTPPSLHLSRQHQLPNRVGSPVSGEGEECLWH